MIIDDIRCAESGGAVERSARFRWRGETLRVFVRLPPDLAPPVEQAGDGSPFLAMGLLPAMMAGEDLEVTGPVSARLLGRVELAAGAYVSWDPGLRRPALRVQGPGATAAAARGVGCFFSRGVDSMLSAVVERMEPGPLTHLIFGNGLEPGHSPPVAREEIRIARVAATLMGLPLVVIETNVRMLTEGRRDWADAHGSALAGVGLALSGCLGAIVIPSTDTFASLVPFGSSPVLDPLFSTELVRVHHDDIALTRVSKVAVLAGQRPDLLPHLKVCFREDRPDNCGRCGKCLLTMAALQAAGGLARATGFPDEIDVDRIRALRLAPLQSRMHWVAVIRALGASGADGVLRAAIAHALRRSARPGPGQWLRLVWSRLRGRRARLHPSWRDPGRGFDWRHHTEVLSLLTRGRPDRPFRAAPELPPSGVRARLAP